MYPEKITWSSVSNVRRNSTYISLEYVLNDIGIFCKGEERSKSLEFISTPMGAPLGLTAIDGTDYAAKPLGRAVILWSKITDVSTDDERRCIIVKGNKSQTIVLQYDELGKLQVLSFINEMRSANPQNAEADEAAATWLGWAADTTSYDVYAPLDELIEARRPDISDQAYTQEMLDATVLEDVRKAEKAQFALPCPSCNFLIRHEEAKFCPNCGKKL